MHHMFQSTRPRGARRVAVKKRFCFCFCFNPRARVGRDRSCIKPFEHKVNVSIHAPAWGATLPLYGAVLFKESFQSTRPRGARLFD